MQEYKRLNLTARGRTFRQTDIQTTEYGGMGGNVNWGTNHFVKRIKKNGF